MGKIIDLTGKTFGKLQVIKMADTKQSGKIHWHCKCECGKEIIVRGDHIKSGHTTSCGCNKYNKGHIDDLTNQRFGKLVVVERDVSKTGNGARWKCLCDCGNYIIAYGTNLKQQQIKSCGCLKSKGEAIIEDILKSLKIDYKKQYTFDDLIGEKKLLRFDFAIFEKEKLICLIEYQGIQHYEISDYFGGEEAFNKQKDYDLKKRNYCNKNKIKLVEIPYWELNKVEDTFIVDLLKKGKE